MARSLILSLPDHIYECYAALAEQHHEEVNILMAAVLSAYAAGVLLQPEAAPPVAPEEPVATAPPPRSAVPQRQRPWRRGTGRTR